jgi:hypothetical protein
MGLLTLDSLIKPYYLGNRRGYLFLVSIGLFSVIPSAPPLLYPLLPACIIQEDEAEMMNGEDDNIESRFSFNPSDDGYDNYHSECSEMSR